MKKEYNEALKKFQDLLDNYKISLEELENKRLDLQNKIGQVQEDKEELEKHLKFTEADKRVNVIIKLQADLNVINSRIDIVADLLQNPKKIEGFEEARKNLKDVASQYRLELLDLSNEKDKEIQEKRKELEKQLEPLEKQKKELWIIRTDVEFLLRRI